MSLDVKRTNEGQHFSSAGPLLLLVLAAKPGLFKEHALWTSFEKDAIMRQVREPFEGY